MFKAKKKTGWFKRHGFFKQGESEEKHSPAFQKEKEDEDMDNLDKDIAEKEKMFAEQEKKYG